MTRLKYSPRHGVCEVELSPIWSAYEARAAAEAIDRLALMVETWPSLDVADRSCELRFAVWDCVTVTLADVAQGAFWVDAVAKLGAIKKTALREIVNYRVDFMNNIPLLCADNYQEAVGELCSQILQ